MNSLLFRLILLSLQVRFRNMTNFLRFLEMEEADE